MWTPADRALVGAFGSGKALTDDHSDFWNCCSRRPVRIGSIIPSRIIGRTKTKLGSFLGLYFGKS
jgi:hypothetical protein